MTPTAVACGIVTRLAGFPPGDHALENVDHLPGPLGCQQITWMAGVEVLVLPGQPGGLVVQGPAQQPLDLLDVVRVDRARGVSGLPLASIRCRRLTGCVRKLPRGGAGCGCVS